MNNIIVLAIIGAVLYFWLKNRAWTNPVQSSIAKLGGTDKYEVGIVGESKYQGALESICGGHSEESAEKYVQAQLFLENDNKYDNQAVRIDIQGQTVGYLSRDDARSYRKQLNQAGHPNIAAVCNAVIVGGWERSKLDTGHFGVKLDLPIA